jgi:hypothetical protein
MSTPPPIEFTDFLVSPPLTPPFRHRGGVSSFGVRRWRTAGAPAVGFTRQLPSTHEGVDLQPAADGDEGAVYAAFWGEVVHISTEDVDGNGNVVMEALTLRCDPPAVGVLFRYLHMVRSLGSRSSGLSVGDRVRSGQLLGFISPEPDDPHLHFEMRIFADTSLTFQDAKPLETFAIDPTEMLYRFDAGRWPRARDEEAFTSWSTDSYATIDRLRLIPWRVQHRTNGIEFHTTHLWQVTIENTRTGTHQSYLPVETAQDWEKELTELIRDAFRTRMRVRLIGRHSHFFPMREGFGSDVTFDSRMMIEDVRVRP